MKRTNMSRPKEIYGTIKTPIGNPLRFVRARLLRDYNGTGSCLVEISESPAALAYKVGDKVTLGTGEFERDKP